MSQQSSPDIDPITDLPWPVDLYGRPMMADDPFLRVMRQRGRWGRGERDLDLPLSLGRGVGRHMPNDPSDVAAMEMWLGQAGYYDLDRRDGPTGYGSPTVDDAILRFQKDHGLTADGWAGPGGETEQALRRQAGSVKTVTPQSFAAPGKRNLLTDEPLLQEAGWSGAARLAAGVWRAWPHMRRWLQPEEVPPAPPPPLPMPTPPVQMPPVDQKPDLPPVPPSMPYNDEQPLRSEDFGVRPGSPGEAILFDEILLMANPHGRRGGKEADRSNQILLQECEGILAKEFPHLREKISHISGGKERGKEDGEEMPEKLIRSIDDPDGKTNKGGSFADMTYGAEKNKDIYAGANTMTTRKDGTPTLNEMRRFVNLLRNAVGRFMGQVPKLGPNVDEHEVRKASGPVCRGIFKSLEEQLAKNEEGEAEKPREEEQR